MEGSAAVDGLASGGAFADLSHWRKVSVTGSGALRWLDSLLSADLDDLAPGRARHALYLSPDGRVLARVTVAVPGGSLLLIQDPVQPHPIDALLAAHPAPEVEMEDRTGDLALFAFPGRAEPPSAPGAAFSAPSCVSPGGVDVVALGEDRQYLAGALGRAFIPAGEQDLEAWRVAAGLPRFGVDALDRDTPADCGLHGEVSLDKGPFPGREAVAASAGPRVAIVALEGEADLSPGDPVVVPGAPGGRVTSAVRVGGRTLALVRVPWEARDGPFRSQGGAELLPRPAPSPADPPP